MAQVQKIGNVFYRVRDMDAAIRFYQDVLGLSLKFRDGNHWAAFDVAGATLALDGDEAPEGGRGGATVSLRVDDLDAFAGQLKARGAETGSIQAGAHERRLELRDPSGNVLVAYQPLAH